MTRVLSGRWKLVIRPSMQLNFTPGYRKIEVLPLQARISPPYITKQLEDQSQYQTVYAKELGSAAAPTAGLHFTPELMDTIRTKGVNIAEVTLHVGLGTFRPVQEDEITDHKMHSEWYSISEETARRIRETKAAGHRVIAVGTTSCRTLLCRNYKKITK